MDGQRQWYAVDRDPDGRAEAEADCAAVLDVLRPVLQRARLDAMSDHTDKMPVLVADAEADLRALARRQRSRGRPVTLVEVTPADAEWAAFERYAAWSIDVDLFAENEQEVASLHDCGWSVVAALTDAEADRVRERLGATAPLTLLAEVHERRRQRKRRLAALWPLRRER